MPATVEEVRDLLIEAFPGADVSVSEEPNNRVGGIIISPEFESMTARERNRAITERVRDRLGLKGLNVGILFPLAPGEQL
ncbi:MAG TPA: hypothetical protein VFJ58_11705 [Armatimonadota bacterium]|nr:hypothetical protein [Armatimonadota bacterium]